MTLIVNDGEADFTDSWLYNDSATDLEFTYNGGVSFRKLPEGEGVWVSFPSGQYISSSTRE